MSEDQSTKEWVEKEAEKLERKLKGQTELPSIKVTAKIDEEKLAQAVKERLEGKDDVTMAKEIFEDMKARLLIKADNLGVEIPEERIRGIKDVEYHVEMLKKLEDAQNKAKSKPSVISGNAPLNEMQVFGKEQSKGYDSYEAMITDLRIREKSSDAQVSADAKAILDTLFSKSILGGQKTKVIEYEGEKEKSPLDTIAELEGKKRRKRQTHPHSRIKIQKGE